MKEIDVYSCLWKVSSRERMLVLCGSVLMPDVCLLDGLRHPSKVKIPESDRGTAEASPFELSDFPISVTRDSSPVADFVAWVLRWDQLVNDVHISRPVAIFPPLDTNKTAHRRGLELVDDVG
eukprot:CAMPEP_0201526732 /NCGR_PEP_ID=MMETSP0161_2-20130828/32722_1 /ASSEMBLY_ACC=CAM_ASM_000251 /TAXON_ID=180227 /ORGANISM="Neoparamoeba aestuarina, Strain SoJaBio B1-5/56/2" /LENGTH=121 /DNA_ID=CAMNT_0047927237 /DNA_START=9 /DNA_END=370 /DNA_ORIENTATION=+